ncbi:MAG: cytochrome P450 [Actinomycetota bacterium]|nr:cytochrome P450 [Actinomycetota bacterium]
MENADIGPGPAPTTDVPAIDVDLWSDDVLADPYPTYARLRAVGPVLYDAERAVYVLTRYDEIRHATQDWETFSSAQGIGVSPKGNRRAGNGILTSDPPRHEQLRKVLNRPLLPRSLAEHQTYVDTTAAQLVAELVDRGSFDAVADLAQRFSIEVVSTLSGFPVEGREHFMRWADDGFNTTGPDNQRCDDGWAGFFEMVDYSFNVLTPDRLAPDRWGRAIHEAGSSGEVEPEACPGLVMAIVWAGMDTTVNAISSAVHLFGRHPDQWDRLRADRSLMSSAMAEVLRIEPPVQRFTRVATRDVELGGATVPEGARIVLLFGSANRDERRFPEPDRFDIGRNPTDHLAFGRGIHRCVGAGLAQQELKAILEQLADRVERFDIAESAWRRNNGLHGLDRLLVTVR